MVTFGSLDADGNYHGEWKLYLTALYKRGERIVATPDQFDAWYAWRAVVRGLGGTARGRSSGEVRANLPEVGSAATARVTGQPNSSAPRRSAVLADLYVPYTAAMKSALLCQSAEPPADPPAPPARQEHQQPRQDSGRHLDVLGR